MEMPICPQHLGEIDCYPWFEANPKISATDARTQVTGSSTSDDCSRAPCIGRSPVLDEPQGDEIPRSPPGCAERKRKPSTAGARLITGKSQVRRKKISERMDVLQGLVPGCHQMKGKALILDEIINYVRSLQNQVEFLSTKLALLSPVLHDLGYLSGQPEDDSSFRRQDLEQEQRCLDEMEFDDMLLFSVENIEDPL
ncbi:unnamed protein product [Musa acuminata subsp. malaccensis]|uniref:(wild Malaysian banana) hypothetical protein n=1 Tax=Musa acuminata subsp. malaccensis TaxID=214687 RepID=A0A804KEK9_MUSAM|nr:unnamed protein product [Musa acuminata subsp. malaccensis]